jgi:hypothetical protein
LLYTRRVARSYWPPRILKHVYVIAITYILKHPKVLFMVVPSRTATRDVAKLPLATDLVQLVYCCALSVGYPSGYSKPNSKQARNRLQEAADTNSGRVEMGPSGHGAWGREYRDPVSVLNLVFITTPDLIVCESTLQKRRPTSCSANLNPCGIYHRYEHCRIYPRVSGSVSTSDAAL